MQTQAIKPTAPADGAAIGAIICAFVIPPLGIILGHVSRGQAKRAGLNPAPVATWGAVLGYLFTITYIIIIIALAVAAVHAANSIPTTCDYTNPNWPNC